MTSWVANLGQFGDKTAIVDYSGQYDYQALMTQIDHYQRLLADQKVPDQSVVALVGDYSFHAIAMLLALVQKKAVIVPLVTSNQAEVDKRLAVVRCDYQIHLQGERLRIEQHPQSEARADLIAQLIAMAEPGLVLFSSGSTGEPKAMVHNMARLLASYQDRKPKSLTLLVFLMFDHIGGLNTLLNGLAMGAKLVLPSSRDPQQVAQLIAQHQVQVLPASPTFLNLMLMAKVAQLYDLSSLKMITYGTEAMPESLLHRLRAAFPKTKFLQTFGTSETGIAHTSSRRSDSLDIKLGDAHVAYKVVDGELWLKSDTQIMGYLNAPMDSFDEQGWFKTGDLVEELDAGYLRIKGRVKEVINVGGEKVLPSEVESVLLQMSQVADCLVYAQPNAITGQMVAAKVVWQGEDEARQPAQWRKQIQDYSTQHLARYKVPAKIHFVEQIESGSRFKKKRVNADQATPPEVKD